MVYVFIYIHLYIQHGYGVWVLSAASSLESVFRFFKTPSRSTVRPNTNNGSGLYIYIPIIYVYIYIYNMDTEFGFYPQPPVSNQFSLFEMRSRFTVRRNTHTMALAYISQFYVYTYIYIQHAHGVWVIFAASRLKSVFALSRCCRVPRCFETQTMAVV